MRRAFALCAATCIAVAAAASPAAAGYYVIRWNNTGVCQIWNTGLQEKPWHLVSDYRIVSRPVPTFTEAAAIQEKMRLSRHCTL